jgi:hypothetical protein
MTSMTDHAAARPRVSRWLIAAGLLVLIVGGWFGYVSLRMRAQRAAAEAELREAIAEADRLDPGWRLEELEAKRALPAGADNGADCIRKARALLPALWPDSGGEELQTKLSDVPPNHLAPPKQVQALREMLRKVAPAIVEARRLADCKHGWFPITWTDDTVSTRFPHLEDVRSVFWLLALDARLRAEENDPDGALLSCRARLNATRSVGSEPSTISQLVQLAGSGTAFVIQRVLALGKPSAEALRVTQELLEEEERHPTLAVMLRAERIWSHRLFAGLSSDPNTWEKYVADFQLGGKSKPEESKKRADELIRRAREVHPQVLHFYTQAIEIAKLPAHLWKDRLDTLLDAQKDIAELLAPFFSDPRLFAKHCKRSLGTLRVAAAAVAVERFRQAHGHWPPSLVSLTPAFLRAVPLDPYDGKSLRYREFEGGVIVYSVNEDGKDDGGNVNHFSSSGMAGTDLGLRLWDVSKRRLPPVNPPPPPPEAEDP